MNCILGIDTSNYTTSCALCTVEGTVLLQKKKLLPVPTGEKGLRQSDALFHHTKALPILLEELFVQAQHPNLCGVGVSTRPRPVEGSYMPCFLAGVNAASAIAAANGLPLAPFSHQEGHIAAAAYSAKLDRTKISSYFALHLSGGTTELLDITDTNGKLTVKCIGGTEDLSAGQVIDRIALAMGLAFPGGAALEALALSTGHAPEQCKDVKASVTGTKCHFSGLENQACRRLTEGESAAQTALYVFATIQKTLLRLLANAMVRYGKKPVLFAGGVMSSHIMRPALQRSCDAYFADGAYASDNAAGIALLATQSYKNVEDLRL